MAAHEAGGLIDAFELAGVEGNETVGIISRIARQTETMGLKSQKAAQATSGIVGLYNKLGLAGKGPSEQMLHMAELAEKNKLSVTELQMVYRVPMETALKMQKVLEKGPHALREQFEEQKKIGVATQANVAMALRIKESQNKISNLWDDIAKTISVNLLPVVEELLKITASKMEKWVEYAQTFGKVLGGFLKSHLGTILQISKVLLLNFAVMKATGKGMLDWGKQGFGMVSKAVLPKAGLAGLIGPAAAKAAPGFGMAGGLIGPALPRGGLSSAAVPFGIAGGRIGPASAPVASKLMASLTGGFLRLKPLLGSLLKLGVIGLALAAVVALLATTVYMIRENIGGIREMLFGWLNQFKARLSVMADLLAPITKLFSGSGVVGKFFIWLVPQLFNMLGKQIDDMLTMVQAIIIMFGKLRSDPFQVLATPIAAFVDSVEEANRLTRQKRIDTLLAEAKGREEERISARYEVPSERPPAPNYDFRGSRFDITQKFAEGFDPDRIAAAFSSDLATLGERRLQSGFTPIGAVR
jgi:hypothetical protein